MIPTADLRVIPSSKVTENFQYQLIRVTDTESAGKRGIRVGKGKETWSGIPDISDDKKKFQQWHNPRRMNLPSPSRSLSVELPLQIMDKTRTKRF